MTRRALHPAAWWLWAGGVAGAAMRTTNVAVLSMLLASVAFVVASRRSNAPWARSFGSFLKLGAFVVGIRMVIDIIFGIRVGDTLLFTLPSIELPSWAAGVTIGGPVTAEMVAKSFREGFRLAVLLACFGALNSLSSPYRMLRALPAVLYEAGVAVTMAVAFAPEAIAASTRLREARRLRGRVASGPKALRGIAVPLLEDALDRSLLLAASMDVRGYGRQGDLPPARRRMASGALLAGLMAAAVGTYGVLDASAPRYLVLPAIAVAVVLLGLALVWKGARSARTRYRPDRFLGPEWLVAASGAVALGAMLVAGRNDAAALSPSVVPLMWPTVPTLALVAAVAAFIPGVAAPEQPSIEPERSASHPVPDDVTVVDA